MAIQRWDPLRDLVDIQQNINRLFDQAFSRSTGAEGVDSLSSSGWKPATDLIEEDDRYLLRADLPHSVLLENSFLLRIGRFNQYLGFAVASFEQSWISSWQRMAL